MTTTPNDEPTDEASEAPVAPDPTQVPGEEETVPPEAERDAEPGQVPESTRLDINA